MRGAVALRCLWELDAGIAFTAPTAVQERNVHDLMRDFGDEQVIYEMAHGSQRRWKNWDSAPGTDACSDNLVRCYERLVELQVVSQRELHLLAAWCYDTQELGGGMSVAGIY
ncbi:MAG: STELLO glycosyltransferase family protein [Candidatus Competibacteraceae bacterium]